MVERFDLDEGGFLNERGRMVPDEFGDYVRVTDYAALERQLAEARAKLEREEHARFVGLMTGPDPAAVWKRQANDLADQLDAAEAERDRLAGENARLREALEFYADISKYPAPFTGGMGALWSDCGQIASSALAGNE